MVQEFRPTINEETLVGGSSSFGSDKWTPTITNITGTYRLYGHFQRVGRIMHFGVLIDGSNGGNFTLSNSMLSIPTKAYRRNIGQYVDVPVFKGVCVQSSNSALTTIMQNDLGGFYLANEVSTGTNTWITGHYWVE